MVSLKFLIKVTRPTQCLIAGLATYVIALLSNGHDWLTTPKIAASLSISLSVLGSSLFHYGAANKMYARKYWDIIEISRPLILIMIGGIIFCVSGIIAYFYLSNICFWIIMINSFGIGIYSRVLSRHWITKNPIIAFICSTPVLMGWLSGNSMHPSLPYFFAIVFFSYLAREIFKDINDIEANGGIRVTLPIWLGNIKHALWIAYASIFCSLIFLLFLFNVYQASSVYAELFYLIALVTFSLIPLVYLKQGTRTLPHFITVANSFIVISIFALRISI